MRFFRAVALVLTTTAVLALPACYAEVTAPGAPPPPRVYVAPVRPGHIWIDGRWHWKGAQWVWMDGHYERERAGHRWMPGHWEPSRGGHRWVPGHWQRY